MICHIPKIRKLDTKKECLYNKYDKTCIYLSLDDYIYTIIILYVFYKKKQQYLRCILMYCLEDTWVLFGLSIDWNNIEMLFFDFIINNYFN